MNIIFLIQMFILSLIILNIDSILNNGNDEEIKSIGDFNIFSNLMILSISTIEFYYLIDKLINGDIKIEIFIGKILVAFSIALITGLILLLCIKINIENIRLKDEIKEKNNNKINYSDYFSLEENLNKMKRNDFPYTFKGPEELNNYLIKNLYIEYVSSYKTILDIISHSELRLNDELKTLVLKDTLENYNKVNEQIKNLNSSDELIQNLKESIKNIKEISKIINNLKEKQEEELNLKEKIKLYDYR